MPDIQSLAMTWGETEHERAMPFPCDRYLSLYDEVYFRAIDIEAPASIVFRWLCQLRAAPYSYDWIDNGGRQSPRWLIQGLEDLQVGQRVMTIFRLVEFEQDRHLTLVLATRRSRATFGEIACSYLIQPQSPQSCRLVVKLLLRYPPKTPATLLLRRVLPWGDLIMMRKQLLTLKRMAERQARHTT